MEKRTILAIAGFATVIPALLLVMMGLSGLEPFVILGSPILIFGGLATALAINAFSVASVNAHLENSNFIGSVTIRWKDALMNLAVIALALGLLGTIMLYLFLENFQPR